MFPILVIAIGIVVLAFGKRLAVLGAAVGALLGVVLLRFLPGSSTPAMMLLIPLLLGVIGFLVAGFAKGIVNIILIVMGVLGGAAIVMGFLNLFNASADLLYLILVVIGGVIGWILVRRYKDWAMMILAGLIGGLLVTRGLTIWMPFLQGALGTLIVLVLAGGSIAYQGGLAGKPKTAG
jgi:hypothetical protein